MWRRKNRAGMSPARTAGPLVLALILCTTLFLPAQTSTATLTGTVSDPSGGVLPGVTVTVTDLERNTSRSSVTRESGGYTVPALNPGVYAVTAQLPGFKRFVRTGVVLQVNQVARIDIVLEVGEITETVEVRAAASLMETETSSRGAVIDERKIVDLPLNGRDYNQLALLSPGVLPGTPRLQSIGFKGAFNVNGNRTFQNVFLLDGVDNVSYSNSFRGDNMQVVQPSIEALQEFKIQTNAYSAEFGRSAGAVINAVLKSGTNEVHGSVYNFHRNDNLDASNFFANRTGQEKPFRLRNQFGAAVGGPIVRDRTFWFADYEGLRDREGTVWISSVPLLPWKQGRFTLPIRNPYDQGNLFPQVDGFYTIPENLHDPVARRILSFVPDPNTGAAGAVSNNFVRVPVERRDQDQFDVKIDHHFSSNVTLFGRYSFVDFERFRPSPKPGLAEASFNDTFGLTTNESQGLALGLTWTFNPTSVLDFRFGHARGDFTSQPPNFDSGCPEELIGLKGAPTDRFICGGLPVIDLPGGNTNRIGRTTSVPQFQTPRSYNYRATASLTRGSHFLKFGTELLFVSTEILDVSSLLGRFNFEGRFTGQNGQLQGGLADLVLGLPSRYRQDSATVFDQGQDMYFFFLQDDWKVSPRFTLNLGLRYEFATPPLEADRQTANIDLSRGEFVQAKRSGSLFEKTLIHPDSNNFAPRVGFAYQPAAGWVIRGGYGIFYNHTNRQGREGLLGFNLPFIIQSDIRVSGNGLLIHQALFRLQDGIPAGLLDIEKVNAANVSRKAQDMFQRSPYVQQWNFGIQRELMKDLLLDVAYVGNKGTKLPGFRNLNQRAVVVNNNVASAGPKPFPQFGDIQFLENRVASSYHSLQLRLERRFADGLSSLLSYTYGKALTGAPDHLATSGAGNGVDVGTFREPQNGFDLAAEKGLAEFDRKHQFVASGIWQIPFGQGRRYGADSSPVVDALLGGWDVTVIASLYSGLGLTITQSQILNLGGERRSRPDRVANGTLPEGQRSVDRWFDTSAFVALNNQSPKAFGNSGVGILRGPGFNNFDFTLAKNFSIDEQRRIQFRTELFNAFNRTNFGVPGVNMSGGFGEIVNAANARIIQFALKFYF